MTDMIFRHRSLARTTSHQTGLHSRTALLKIGLFVKCTMLVLASLALVAVADSALLAQESDVVDNAPSVGNKSTVGIDGHYRIGRWTMVRLNSASAQSAKSLSIETVDGDGVPIVYEQAVYEQADSANDTAGYGYVIPGSEAAPLVIRVDDQQVESTRFPLLGSPSRGPSAIPNEMTWVVCIGDPMGIDQLGANELLKRDAQIAVSVPGEATSLPESSLGYDGVDMILINQSGFDLLSDLNGAQQAALVQHIRTGGRLLLTFGESVSRLKEAAPWLLEMLPLGDHQITTSKMNPAALETYTTSQTPLDPYVGARLPRGVGEVLLSGRTSRRVSTPVAVDYSVGMGNVTVVATDLDSDAFATWPDRMGLLKRLTGSILDVGKEKASQTNRLTAFNDLAGQARATLDQFSVKRRFDFSVLSLILMALIALIGPLDYLLINRVFGKPLLGWLTFPIVVIGLSTVLAMQATPAKVAANSTAAGSSEATSGPAESSVRCNRIEFVDVDAKTGTGTGFAWSFLYTHSARQLDVDVQPSAQFSELADSVVRQHTAPYGTPGKAFGGIQISGQDARIPRYRVVAERAGDQSNQMTASIRELALAPRSSKSLATRVMFQANIPTDLSVRQRRASELLEGGLVNPLPCDLLDGMLVFGNWVYILPTRFVAGGQIDSLADLRQKNFRWQLSRQQMLEKREVKNEKWNPANFDSPSRVAEMLMFHEAVGGVRYTGLRDDPLSFLDLSDSLTDDRCILVGRVRDPMWNVNRVESGGDAETVEGDTLTMVRVVMPVKR